MQNRRRFNRISYLGNFVTAVTLERRILAAAADIERSELQGCGVSI